jgi:ribose-phosphate pyrophosphokinase
MRESVLVCLDGNNGLAEEIIHIISTEPIFKQKVVLDKVNSRKFSDNELNVDFASSIRGKRVYILSSPNTSDEIIKLNLAIDAAKRSAAKEIIPIIPYFPYQRSDKKDQSRGPIGAKIMAEMIEQRGATGIITFDLHSDQIQGFFNIPVTHLEGKNIFDNYIARAFEVARMRGGEMILCGPDAGSGKRVKRMKTQLEKYYKISPNYVMMDKTRKEANVVDSMVIIGDVKGKDIIILDDMVDTAGTLCKASDVLMEAGAKSVIAIISHGVLSGDAYSKIEKSSLNKLIVTDSLPIDDDANKIGIISLSRQIALAMGAINSESSYEGLKKEKF